MAEIIDLQQRSAERNAPRRDLQALEHEWRELERQSHELDEHMRPFLKKILDISMTSYR